MIRNYRDVVIKIAQLAPFRWAFGQFIFLVYQNGSYISPLSKAQPRPKIISLIIAILVFIYTKFNNKNQDTVKWQSRTTCSLCGSTSHQSSSCRFANCLHPIQRHRDIVCRSKECTSAKRHKIGRGTTCIEYFHLVLGRGGIISHVSTGIIRALAFIKSEKPPEKFKDWYGHWFVFWVREH